MQRIAGVLVVLALVGSLSACGGREDEPPVQDTPVGQPPATQPPATTPPGPDTGGAMGNLPAGVTAEMVQQGQQQFNTVCVACHGQAGAGTQLGPALNDQQWIHGSGEFEEIVNVIRTGVPQPQEYPNPMPPNGGGNFTDEQVRAVAAYVYSISHNR